MNPEMLVLVSALCVWGLAIVALVREERSLVRNVFVAGLAVLGLEAALIAIGVGRHSVDFLAELARVRLAVSALVPGIWLVFSLCYSRGNYRDFLQRWRLAIVLAFVLPLGLCGLFWGELITGADLEPETGLWVLSYGRPAALVDILAIVGAVLILTNLERTLRTTIGTMRWRIKFMVLGLGALFVIRLYGSSQSLLYATPSLGLEGLTAISLIVAGALMGLSLLRGRLLHVDVYPSHAVLRNSLTILLAGVYLVVVGFLAQIIAWLGAVAGMPAKGFFVLVGFLGLAVLLLSNRVRQATSQFVTRHFHRPRYDYSRVWKAFARQTASAVQLPDFCRAVVRVVSDTLEALSVTVWTVDESRDALVFGGSTSLTDEQAQRLRSTTPHDAELLAALRALPGPFNLETAAAPWAEQLRSASPGTFEAPGGRVCVPLSAQGQLLGVMVLGDRVGEAPYTAEEFDLLKTIGDHVGSSLLNIRLSRRLLESREMEAFQTMSTFFVHDLKNTASSLTLLLRNMPKHFADPAFRDDALKAIAKSVGKINDLIQRLTALRQQKEPQRVPTDLSGLAAQALGAMTAGEQIRVIRNLGPVAKAPMDPEQMQKVVVNLVLNAVEAISGAGEIRVETGQADGRVWLSVSDTGCGMSRAFMERSLFHPFQTSKREGMGIGLFQCKRIMEAHGGRIEVESEEGRGTTFRVWLPATGVNQ